MGDYFRSEATGEIVYSPGNGRTISEAFARNDERKAERASIVEQMERAISSGRVLPATASGQLATIIAEETDPLWKTLSPLGMKASDILHSLRTGAPRERP